jgi:oleate hydratase
VLPFTQHNSAREVTTLIMMPSDTVVFLVEYSDRTAQTAVYRLPDLHRELPAVYKRAFDLCVLFKAFVAMHDLHA